MAVIGTKVLLTKEELQQEIEKRAIRRERMTMIGTKVLPKKKELRQEIL